MLDAELRGWGCWCAVLCCAGCILLLTLGGEPAEKDPYKLTKMIKEAIGTEKVRFVEQQRQQQQQGQKQEQEQENVTEQEQPGDEEQQQQEGEEQQQEQQAGSKQVGAGGCGSGLTSLCWLVWLLLLWCAYVSVSVSAKGLFVASKYLCRNPNFTANTIPLLLLQKLTYTHTATAPAVLTCAAVVLWMHVKSGIATYVGSLKMLHLHAAPRPLQLDNQDQSTLWYISYVQNAEALDSDMGAAPASLLVNCPAVLAELM